MVLGQGWWGIRLKIRLPFANHASFIDRKRRPAVVFQSRFDLMARRFTKIAVLEAIRAMLVVQAPESFRNRPANIGEKVLPEKLEPSVVVNIVVEEFLSLLVTSLLNKSLISEFGIATNLARLQTLAAMHATQMIFHTRRMSALNSRTTKLLRGHGNT